MQKVPAVRGILPVLRVPPLREISSANKKINGLKLHRFKRGNDVCSVLPFPTSSMCPSHQSVGIKPDTGQSFLIECWVIQIYKSTSRRANPQGLA